MFLFLVVSHFRVSKDARCFATVHYLSPRSSNLVDDVSKDNILIIRVTAHLLPLRILSQPDIITKKRMANAVRIVSLLVTRKVEKEF